MKKGMKKEEVSRKVWLVAGGIFSVGLFLYVLLDVLYGTKGERAGALVTLVFVLGLTIFVGMPEIKKIGARLS